MRRTVNSKILTIMTFSVIICSIAIGFLSIHVSRRALDKSIKNNLLEIGDRAAAEIKSINDAEFIMLHALAELPEIKSEDVSIAEKCAIFQGIVQKNPNKYENIAFYDTEGNTSLPNGVALQLKGKPYIEDPVRTGNYYIDDPRFSTVNDSILMFMSVPVYNNYGKAIGCVVSVIRGDVLNEIAKGIEIIEGNHVNIVNTKSRQIIARGIDASEEDNDQIEDRIILENTTDFALVFEKICNRERGIDFYRDEETGKTKIASFCPVEGYDWAVLCPAPYAYFIKEIKNLSYNLVITTIIVVIITVLLTIAFNKKILSSLKNLTNSIIDISEGNADLTKRMDETSTDEIGDVVKGFNIFVEKVHTIMTQINNSKDELISNGQKLVDATFDTSASITEIIANIESVHKQISYSSDSVSTTADSVTDIARNIDALERLIENQSMGVAQASAAIEQMISNISSVNNSVDMMALSFKELFDKTTEGTKLQVIVNDKIQQIKEQSETLQEANQVIATIAEQTNLLAMNAAIEAAHAGEAGKGFSVVADEIRKLSETSTEQSNTIGKQLENISYSIAEVVDQCNKSNDTFVEVTSKIQSTDRLVQQIKLAMNEQNHGSIQINDSLHIMNDSTLDVRTASKEMSEGNKVVIENIKRLEDITDQISQSMNEMSIGAKKINETGNGLKDISNKMHRSVISIGAQVDLFKI